MSFGCSKWTQNEVIPFVSLNKYDKECDKKKSEFGLW
jgi:hypothetical protein